MDGKIPILAAEDTETVTSAQMKEIERKADAAGLSYYQMMENAGTGAAVLINEVFPVAGKKILIVCGKGNNGGDGFVVARKFREWDAEVMLILAEGEPKTEDALKNRLRCRDMAIPTWEDMTFWSCEYMTVPPKLQAHFQEADLIIDAIYGTGFRGALREPVRMLTRMINEAGGKIYALDIPSGLNGDSCEADEDTIRADGTIVFHRRKPAHANEECVGYCGRIDCISIGIEAVLKD